MDFDYWKIYTAVFGTSRVVRIKRLKSCAELIFCPFLLGLVVWGNWCHAELRIFTVFLREASVRETDNQVLSSVTSLWADISELTGSFTAKHQERRIGLVTPPASYWLHPYKRVFGSSL